MRLLLLTNLFPPQELGGYGRSLADFAWGMTQRGHQVQVLSSDAPYLGAIPAGSEQAVERSLQLKGTYNGGLQNEGDGGRRRAIDAANQAVLLRWMARGPWHGALVGNLDLLGMELLEPLLQAGVPVLHHLGFVLPPCAPPQWPRSHHYQLVAASAAVRSALVAAGLPVAGAPVVFPGARVELFGAEAVGRPLPPPAPLRIAFAGLLMPSKGVHTLVEALIHLHRRQVPFSAMLAGQGFTPGYREELEAALARAGLAQQVRFVGALSRPQLARFFAVHNVCVFPSLQPEAFGIVQAEAMAAGLALVSSGVGGAAEVFENGISGLQVAPGDSQQLAAVLSRLAENPTRLRQLGAAGQQRARTALALEHSVAQLEQLFLTARASNDAAP